MDFIKRNLFLLICAVVGLGSLGGMVWGMTRMSGVTARMDQIKGIEANLNGTKAVGVDHVTNEYDRIRRVVEYHEAMLVHFTERTRLAPLMEGLLPDPGGSEEESKELRYEFRPTYQRAMRELMTILQADVPPSKADIEDVADYLKKRKMEAELTGEVEQPVAPEGRGAAGPGGPGGLAQSEEGDLPERDGPATCRPYWQALAERVSDSPEALAAIDRAREVYCYADVSPGGSFDLHPLYRDSDQLPNMYEIWEAHRFYWPQRGVVDVLAAVNNRAAEALQQAGEKPWVGNLPVKDLLSIRISNFILEDSEDPGNLTEDLPPEDPVAVFTQQFGHNLFDVLNIRVRVVLDIRDLPALLHEFTNQRYTVVTNVNYQRKAPQTKFTEKIYGPEPVVTLTLDLQTYLSYRSTVPLMPEVVREELGTEAQFEELVGGEEEDETGEDDG